MAYVRLNFGFDIVSDPESSLAVLDVDGELSAFDGDNLQFVSAHV